MSARFPVSALSDAQRLDWLRLIRSDNIGPRTFRSLINRHGSAAAALDALPTLAGRAGKTIKIAPLDEAMREMEESSALGVRFVALGEAAYPARLRAIDAAPPLLAVRGNIPALAKTMVAIVGSRNASAAGLAFAERLARGLAQAGHVVVSGLARGIDARAHRSTLHTGTVAVLAGGHARIYPADHAALVEQILETGAVITEMPLNWEARGRDFPRRNRIVSGLALGTVVIEAARHSGSLITAKFASEQGREVFAVPGSPLDPRAEGTNDLLREGANICTCVEDVVNTLAPIIGRGEDPPDLFREFESAHDVTTEPLWDEFDLDGGEPPPVPRTLARMEMDEEPRRRDLTPPHALQPEARRKMIVALLGPSPVDVDELARAAGAPMAEVRDVLLELELAGRLERHGGNLVSLI